MSALTQSKKIEAMITDINLMDWDDDLYDLFTSVTDKLEDLLTALNDIDDEPGRDVRQERADYLESVL